MPMLRRSPALTDAEFLAACHKTFSDACYPLDYSDAAEARAAFRPMRPRYRRPLPRWVAWLGLTLFGLASAGLGAFLTWIFIA